MAVAPVTPAPGLASQVPTGGTPVAVSNGGDNGGFITNPASAADQGLSAPESIYVDPVANASTSAGGTTFEIPPGATWTFIPGQTTPTSVNAASSGHKFSVVRF